MLKDPVDCNPETADTPFSNDQNSIDGQPPPVVLPDAKSFPKKRKREFDADCTKVQSDKVFRTPFFKKLSDRVNGKPLTDLVFIEIFSGTGGLCAEVRKWGLANSVGVDAHISKQTKSPVIRIDLTDSNGVSLLWRTIPAKRCIGPPWTPMWDIIEGQGHQTWTTTSQILQISRRASASTWCEPSKGASSESSISAIL